MKKNNKSGKKKVPKKVEKLLNSFLESEVEKMAKLKGVDVSTKAKLNKFYKSRQKDFDALFYSEGLQSIPRVSTTVFDNIDLAKEAKQKFYIVRNGIKKEVTPEKMKVEIALTEQWLNNTFDATGTEFSFKETYSGEFIINLPVREDESELLEEDSEIITDYFMDEYGINIYLSEPKNKKQYALNEKYRDDYSSKVKLRVKESRKQFREANKINKNVVQKNKAKRKKH